MSNIHRSGCKVTLNVRYFSSFYTISKLWNSIQKDSFSRYFNESVTIFCGVTECLVVMKCWHFVNARLSIDSVNHTNWNNTDSSVTTYTIQWPYVDSMLDQRRRRWASIEPMLGQWIAVHWEVSVTLEGWLARAISVSHLYHTPIYQAGG